MLWCLKRISVADQKFIKLNCGDSFSSSTELADNNNDVLKIKYYLSCIQMATSFLLDVIFTKSFSKFFEETGSERCSICPKVTQLAHLSPESGPLSTEPRQFPVIMPESWVLTKYQGLSKPLYASSQGILLLSF